MYLLDFLTTAARGAENTPQGVTVEHRLACSGELYNSRVITANWRKSDVTRVLARSPFELFVVSQPFDAYPQELCLRGKLGYVTEQSADQNLSFRSTFLPDDEIVEDLCSVLSLLARRLIVPIVSTRQIYGDENKGLGSFGTDWPYPLLDVRYTSWKRRLATVVTKGPHDQ